MSHIIVTWFRRTRSFVIFNDGLLERSWWMEKRWRNAKIWFGPARRTGFLSCQWISSSLVIWRIVSSTPFANARDAEGVLTVFWIEGGREGSAGEAGETRRTEQSQLSIPAISGSWNNRFVDDGVEILIDSRDPEDGWRNCKSSRFDSHPKDRNCLGFPYRFHIPSLKMILQKSRW